jgi:hypothetical protein
MPSKREIAARLTRGELKKVVDRYDIDVADRRVGEGLVEAVAGTARAKSLASNKSRVLTLMPPFLMTYRGRVRDRRRDVADAIPRQCLSATRKVFGGLCDVTERRLNV